MMINNITTTDDMVRFLQDQYKQTNNVEFMVAADAIQLTERTCELLRYELDQQNKWISVDDRQPKRYGKYLVACKGIDIPQIRMYEGAWDSLEEVTHWQRLPKMPEVKEA